MSDSGACPVIHKITDGQKCPVNHTESAPDINKDLADLDKEFDSIGEQPSLKQYKKTQRVMSTITGFYENGTKKKFANYETMCNNLKMLQIDIDCANAQMEALSSKPAFVGHPKAIEYKEFLDQELARFATKKKSMEAKRDEFFHLHKWSGVINEVCRWLEDNFDSYAVEVIPELKGKIKVKPVVELTPEKAKLYSKGLDEITYNLKESQDFFQAAVDGRLKIFHEIEQEIIETQMQVLSNQCAEDNRRRILLTEELRQDLEYVKLNDDESEQSLKRKKKMLRNHRAYLKVLKYHTEKLKVLTDLPPQEQREYDPKWTWLSKLEVEGTPQDEQEEDLSSSEEE